MPRARKRIAIGVATLCAIMTCLCLEAGHAQEKKLPPATFHVASPVDGAPQPCLFRPADAKEPRPLVVALHPWSNGFNTYAPMKLWEAQAAARQWHYLQPHFRGPNCTPDACASSKARQDVLDAVDYVLAHYAVDTKRVYLVGGSGGGHMALVMAGHAPERWAAVSAWVPITDLAVWHAESLSANRKYWQDIEACVGGPPGACEAVDKQLRYRSPIFTLDRARDVPIDINAGIHDGHAGSVPIHHTLDAFNALARACGAAAVTPEEIARLGAERPLDVPAEQDPSYGRTIYLRRYAGPSRVTIFEGGHEGEKLAPAAFAWLERHAKP